VATLAVYRGDQFLRRVELGEGPLRIGRAPESDLVLEDKDKGVSRTHAEIRYERGRHVIVDLNSQNGVWLGDRRVRLDALPVEVPVTIGPYRLVLELQPPRPEGISETQPVPDNEEGGLEATHLSPPPAPVAPKQPAAAPSPPPSRRRLYAATLGVLGVAAVVLVAAILLRTPEPKIQLPPDPPPPQAGPTKEEQFLEHFEKARAYLANREKASAMSENEAARKILPDDPRGLNQQQEIALVPDAPPSPGDTDSQALPAGSPQPAGPATLIISVIAGESQKERAKRDKDAKDYLDDGKARLKEGEYDRAISLFDNAMKKSGRSDYGYKPNEAQQLLAQARQAKEQAENELKAKRAQDLIARAKARDPKDIADTMKDLQEARNIDPSTAGLNDLIRELQERARSEGEQAYKEARQYDSKRRNQEALTNFERAVQLLELVPGGSEHLEYAKKRLEELRAPR
jgi:hypothetical protein